MEEIEFSKALTKLKYQIEDAYNKQIILNDIMIYIALHILLKQIRKR